MTLDPATLELRFEKSDYGLSARRLWEHTELGQVNVFSQAISSHQELNSAQTFIDVISYGLRTFSLAGFTLAEMRSSTIPTDKFSIEIALLSRRVDTHDVRAFIRKVTVHIEQCSMRKATRNQHQSFFSAVKTNDVFGVQSTQVKPDRE
jgi:hypothetical protein